MSPVELRRGGLHLTGTALSLDAPRKSALSFVSHAHSDHIARHERIIASGATIKLMTHRLGHLPGALPAPYRRPFELGPLMVELFPAGHILGSAQIRVTRDDGHRVVYTGDLNLEPSLTAEPAEILECDTLVIESTFGHPRFAFPPRDQVLSEVVSWVQSQLEHDRFPILLGYPLGKAQEVIKHLGDQGFSLVAHPSIYDIAQLYIELGVPLNVRRFAGHLNKGEVGIFPPFGRSKALRELCPRATAVLTGWALDPGAARRYGADTAFPLSDHADFRGLLTYAQKSKAEEVVTHHGFAHELAQHLRQEGVFARPVGKPMQMELF